MTKAELDAIRERQRMGELDPWRPEFIEQAPEDIAALVAEVERLQDEVIHLATAGHLEAEESNRLRHLIRQMLPFIDHACAERYRLDSGETACDVLREVQAAINGE